MKRFVRSLGSLAALRLGMLALPLVLAAGCNTYKYFEIHLSFDPATLDSSETGYISSCQVTVSGSDKDSFPLDPAKCPPHNSQTPLDVGTFEYSSFVESGTLNFKVEAFTGLGQKPECKLGEGMTAVPVTGLTTITGSLVVGQTGSVCADGIMPAGN